MKNKIYPWMVSQYYDFINGDRKFLSFQVDEDMLQKLKKALRLESQRRIDLTLERIRDFEKMEKQTFYKKYDYNTLKPRRTTKWMKIKDLKTGKYYFKLRKT